MKKKYKCLVGVILITMILLVENLVVNATSDATDLKLYARSALLMDAANGRVLYEENGYSVMPMASTTKIMTCIIALESGRTDEIVTISENAQRQPKVRLNLRKGEEYVLRDLLFSLMLESHNDSAVAIAEHIGGSVSGFAELMNQKAKELACENTYFITPNGLDATENGKQHSTTAYDLALIASYAIKNQEFLDIIATKSYSFNEIESKRGHTVSNKDAFLSMYNGAIGIKTGFTSQAGYCFVGAVENEEGVFVSVVLGCGWPPNKSWKWVDTRTLMNYGTENFRLQELTLQKQYGEIEIENGQEEHLNVEINRPDVCLLLADWEEVSVETDLPITLEAPIQEGEVVGFEEYCVDGETICAIPILAGKEIAKITWLFCLKRLVFNFLL